MQRTHLSIAVATALAISTSGCAWFERMTDSNSGGTSSGTSTSGTTSSGGGSYYGGGRSASGTTATVDADQVRKVQEQLRSKGYDVGTVDGRMGDQTRSALRNFQQSQGLQATGELDARTMSALGVQPTTSGMSGTRGNSTSSSTTGSGAGGTSTSAGGSSSTGPAISGNDAGSTASPGTGGMGGGSGTPPRR